MRSLGTSSATQGLTDHTALPRPWHPSKTVEHHHPAQPQPAGRTTLNNQAMHNAIDQLARPLQYVFQRWTSSHDHSIVPTQQVTPTVKNDRHDQSPARPPQQPLNTHLFPQAIKGRVIVKSTKGIHQYDLDPNSTRMAADPTNPQKSPLAWMLGMKACGQHALRRHHDRDQSHRVPQATTKLDVPLASLHPRPTSTLTQRLTALHPIDGIETGGGSQRPPTNQPTTATDKALRFVESRYEIRPT